MDWIKVDSKNIAAVRYDEETETLFVKFNYGTTYEYLNVPKTEYDALMAAESKGKYHHLKIKSQYAFHIASPNAD